MAIDMSCRNFLSEMSTKKKKKEKKEKLCLSNHFRGCLKLKLVQLCITGGDAMRSNNATINKDRKGLGKEKSEDRAMRVE